MLSSLLLGCLACGARIGGGEEGDGSGDGSVALDAAVATDGTPPGAIDASVAPPDAGPCVPGSYQLLDNQAFDDGPVTWTEVGGPINYPDSQIPIDVHSGTRAAWLGRPAQADQKLSQVVDIPPGTVSLTWSGYTCFVTARVDASTDDVKIRLLDGATVVESLIAYGDEDAASVCNWTPRSAVAPDPHPGERLEFALSAHSDNSVLSSFYFDTLALTAVVECP